MKPSAQIQVFHICINYARRRSSINPFTTTCTSLAPALAFYMDCPRSKKRNIRFRHILLQLAYAATKSPSFQYQSQNLSLPTNLLSWIPLPLLQKFLNLKTATNMSWLALILSLFSQKSPQMKLLILPPNLSSFKMMFIYSVLLLKWFENYPSLLSKMFCSSSITNITRKLMVLQQVVHQTLHQPTYSFVIMKPNGQLTNCPLE